MVRGVLGGVVLAILWVGGSWLSYLLAGAGGSLSTLALLVPSPGARGVFGSPLAWALLVQALMVVVLIVGFTVLAPRLSPGDPSDVPPGAPARGTVPPTPAMAPTAGAAFAGGWLAAILVAFAIGAAQDVGSFLVWLGPFGVHGALRTMGAASMTAWWAVLVGWIPALVWARSRRRVAVPAAVAPAPAAASVPDSVSAPGPGRASVSKPLASHASGVRWAVTSAIAAMALILVPVATAAGDAATQQQLREDQAVSEAQADPDGAAAPDPDAPGEPVPTAAPDGTPSPDGFCTAEDTTIMAPAPDAATGHRGQYLQVVNVSEEPCTFDGYPDVAYGDQNGHLLDVTVEHGRSFMAEDPGAAAFTLQPGDSATAAIGWDANSVHGQLAARSLWLAVRPGEQRLSWEVSLDIVPGATVHVTAWHLAPSPAG
ncbi:DUF4232 domain-containing protein [Microbacterium sp. XT11]|uniref:DUF4232 domain-containing protein n=1 Tax=Microbacterium sp. XT11 TaxID=367477 RepID=UPI0007430C6E|nr:DUF4232 domain-containing protein [Microbacterium sp. XT11]ALX66544.1 hypothetical protein AB663_001769 [Microbacterium sp. XT11]